MIFLHLLKVVTLVLYSYFVAALVGRQMVPHVDGVVGKYEDPDLYFPLFTALQVSLFNIIAFMTPLSM